MKFLVNDATPLEWLPGCWIPGIVLANNIDVLFTKGIVDLQDDEFELTGNLVIEVPVRHWIKTVPEESGSRNKEDVVETLVNALSKKNDINIKAKENTEREINLPPGQTPYLIFD